MKVNTQAIAEEIADALIEGRIEYGTCADEPALIKSYLDGYLREGIKELCDFVKTDDFKESWVKAKGVAFGDFLAEILKEAITWE